MIAFVNFASRLALCALLIGIPTVGWGDELALEEATGRISERTTESQALEDALEPTIPPRYRPSAHNDAKHRHAQPSPQADTPDARVKQPEAVKSRSIRITNHRNTISQFDRIQEALRQGNLAAASDSYETILKSDPRNTDALLGLALIHLRKGNTSIAETLIAKTLTFAPRDSLALALRSLLHVGGNSAQEESRLQQALSDQPDGAPLHFSLGNLYARQGRWREAQQAYFQATTRDRDHPDYLFNLAVSLEHINMPQAAWQYYQAALAAADLRPASFSRTVATDRVGTVGRSSP